MYRLRCFLLIIAASILVATIFSAACEGYSWDCPSCGRTGNTGNYCGGCGHPAPWKEELSASDENPFTIYIIEDTYVRTRPSTDNSTSKMLIRAEAGESFTAYARVPSENGGKDYYQIIYNGQYAYITTSKSSIGDNGDMGEGSNKDVSYGQVVPASISLDVLSEKEIVEIAYTLEDGDALSSGTALTGKVTAIIVPWSEEYKKHHRGYRRSRQADPVLSPYR